MNVLTRCITLIATACVATSMAWAQANAPGASPAKPSGADASFLKQAAENGHAEVESSKLALKKITADDPIRRFAQTMVDEHQKAGSELKALATSKGVQVSDQPSMVQRAKIQMLSNADGASFSRRYIEGMGVNAHKDTIKLFEKAAANADDADVKAFASRTLPTLEKHMTMAQDLQATQQMNKDAKGDRSTTGTRSTP